MAMISSMSFVATMPVAPAPMMSPASRPAFSSL
jgi:hypothetical protein